MNNGGLQGLGAFAPESGRLHKHLVQRVNGQGISEAAQGNGGEFFLVSIPGLEKLEKGL
jgi:hypothetical protein